MATTTTKFNHLFVREQLALGETVNKTIFKLKIKKILLSKHKNDRL